MTHFLNTRLGILGYIFPWLLIALFVMSFYFLYVASRFAPAQVGSFFIGVLARQFMCFCLRSVISSDLTAYLALQSYHRSPQLFKYELHLRSTCSSMTILHQGLTTIHAFGKEQVMSRIFYQALDANTNTYFLFLVASRWFACRLELVTTVRPSCSADRDFSDLTRQTRSLSPLLGCLL
jgi:hypothetical protein